MYLFRVTLTTLRGGAKENCRRVAPSDMTLTQQSVSPVAILLACKSQEDLAAFFGITVERLCFHLYSDKSPKYSEFTIPKAGGGTRSIAAPPATLRAWQSSLAELLSFIYVPKDATHGFVSARSVATNASRHLGRNLVLNLDLADFFPTIHFGRVRGLFLKPPFSFSTEVASTLAQLCTHDGRLPQGAPTSPIISNFVCRRLDTDLDRLEKKHSCRVTRYADDITFSTNAPQFPAEIAAAHDPYGAGVTLGAELLHIIAKHNFAVQPAKTRVRTRHRRQEVTGLIVNRRLNVPRAYIRRIRAILNEVRKFGFPTAEAKFTTLDGARMRRTGSAPSLSAHLRGKLEYLRMIRGDGDPVYVKYALRARQLKIEIPPVRITDPATRLRDFIEESIWVVIGHDASGSQVAQGTAFHLEGAGMVTASHVLTQPAVPVTKWSLLSMRPPYSTANIVGYVADPHLDLAILKTDAFLTGSLSASAVEPKPQQHVRLVGYPNWHSLGDHSLMAEGPIVQTKAMSGLHYSSVGYPLLSGASGAPVLSLAGQVVGVVVHSSGHSSFPNAFVSIAHVGVALAGQHHAL
jgi:RNA-directed DNA polymerase